MISGMYLFFILLSYFSLYSLCEKERNPARCEVGDLEHKHEPLLAVVGRRRDIADTKRFYTDSNLPLTG